MYKAIAIRKVLLEKAQDTLSLRYPRAEHHYSFCPHFNYSKVQW